MPSGAESTFEGGRSAVPSLPTVDLVGRNVVVTPVRRYRKLKPGPGLSAHEVVKNQRARLMGALVGICAQEGYGSVTVRELSRRAGVSTKSFYDCFGNVEECFGSAYSWIAREALRRVAGVGETGPEVLRLHFESFLAIFAAHPEAGRVVLLEVCAAGPASAAKEKASLRALESLVRTDIESCSEGSNPPPWLVRGILAALLRFARAQLLDDQPLAVAPAAAELAGWASMLSAQDVGWLSQVDSSAVGQIFELPPSDKPIGDERRRLLDAAARLTVSDGYDGLTGPAIRRTAGVSRRVFDENFDGVAEVVLEAVEVQVLDAMARAERAVVVAPTWARGIVRASGLLCAELGRNQRLSQLAFVDLLSLGRKGLERRERIVAKLASRLRLSAPDHARPSPLLAEASLAAVWRIAEAEIRAGHRKPSPVAASAIAYMILAPAIGSEAAKRSISDELHLDS
jgi:AcrR family transcriptional regulator